MKGKKMLNTLYQEALDRKTNPKEGSYTNYLYTKGLDKILKKVGEESTEVVLAAKNADKDENLNETLEKIFKNIISDYNIEKSIDPKRFKSKFEKEKRTNNVKIDKLLEDEKTATNVKATNANKGQETDEYFSKVQELLNVWNPVGTGLKAVVLIMIDLDGKFDYRFVTKSGDEAFDSSLKAFLDQQINVAYPKPTKDKDIKANITFRSEG